MTLTMPTVQDCFLPLLRVLAAGGEPMVEQAVFQATKQEGFSALPSIFHIQTDKRGVPLIQRRIAWAKFYLNAAGFIQHRSRNLIQITEGDALRSNPMFAPGPCFPPPVRGDKNLDLVGYHRRQLAKRYGVKLLRQ